MERALITPQEAADLAGLHVQTIRRWIRDDVPGLGVVVGRRYWVRRAALMELIEGGRDRCWDGSPA
jgi:excisionase family DNA binding protein